MSSKKSLTNVISNSIDIGNRSYKVFKKKNAIEYGKLAVKAYNTAIRAISAKQINENN